MTAQPGVCISVLNWNSYQHTLHCLQALTTLDYANYSIVVVDNGSSDDSVAHIRAAFPDIRIIESAQNLGFADGNGLALKAALADSETELFWILNNDAIVLPNTLSSLVNAYKEEGAGLYGGVPLLFGAEPWKINQYVLIKFLKGTHFIYTTTLNHLPYNVYFPSKQPQVVNNLHGSSMLIPLAVVQNHGFMDSKFFLYGEENDYCLRLKARGVPSVLVPQSVAFHAGGGSSNHRSGVENVIQYYRTRNMLLNFRRHSGFLYYSLQVLYSFFKLGRNLLSGKRVSVRYTLLGIRDSIIGRVGKTIAPEDFVGEQRKV